MSGAKHTPAPWAVPDQTYSRRLTVEVARDAGDFLIPCPGSGGAKFYTKTVCTLDWSGTDEWNANAHLISAAPDLLEALETMLRFVPADIVECRGDKCRKPWCASCCGDDEAEEAIQKVRNDASAARAAIAKAKGGAS